MSHDSPTFEDNLIEVLWNIAGSLERCADALAGSDEEDSTPGMAESLTVLTSAALEVVDPEPETGAPAEAKPS